MNHIETMKQALDALVEHSAFLPSPDGRHYKAGYAAIEALRAAIAQLSLSVGDSHFESWYSEYQKAGGSMKPQMRDAYAAGMGDPLVAIAQPDEPVAWMDNDGNISDNNDHNCFSIPLYDRPAQPYVPLSDPQKIRELWASENGLEDCDMCKLHDFEKVYRAIERAVRGIEP